MTGPGNWIAVVEDDRYLVSDQGDVFSHISGRLLKPSPDSHGRLNIWLAGRRRRLVHRLMLEAFVGPCPEGLEACHWDDDHTNNTLGNLRWDTRSANRHDSVRNGRHHNAKKTHCKRGHEYTPENTYLTKPGTRACRTCMKGYGKGRVAA